MHVEFEGSGSECEWVANWGDGLGAWELGVSVVAVNTVDEKGLGLRLFSMHGGRIEC
jgi:hypothetical protein